MERKFSIAELQIYLVSPDDDSNREIREYLKTDAGKHFLEEYLLSVWTESASALLDLKKEEEFYHYFLLKKKMTQSDIEPDAAVVPIKNYANRFSYFKYIAAAIIIFVIIGLGMLEISKRDPVNQTSLYGIMDSISTGAGQYAQVKMSDGSHVRLGPLSQLTYPRKFSGEERYVTLKGQGYFEIHKDPQRPFRILSNNYVTTVLGTTFLIDSYGLDRYRLFVSSGKVQVEKNDGVGKTYILGVLTKGYELMDEMDRPLIKETNTTRLEAWLNGDLVFNGEKLEQIVEEINRHYDLHIAIENNQLKELPITTIIKKGTDIDQFLKQSGEIFGFRYSKKGNQYTIQ